MQHLFFWAQLTGRLEQLEKHQSSAGVDHGTGSPQHIASREQVHIPTIGQRTNHFWNVSLGGDMFVSWKALPHECLQKGRIQIRWLISLEAVCLDIFDHQVISYFQAICAFLDQLKKWNNKIMPHSPTSYHLNLGLPIFGGELLNFRSVH